MTGRPTAAPPYFPYDHPSMAVVMVWEGSLWKSCGHERRDGQHRCATCQSEYHRARYQRVRGSVTA